MKTDLDSIKAFTFSANQQKEKGEPTMLVNVEHYLELVDELQELIKDKNSQVYITVGDGLSVQGSSEAIHRVQDYILLDSSHPIEKEDVRRSLAKALQSAEAKIAELIKSDSEGELALTDSDGLMLEAAEQLGFSAIDDDATVYRVTARALLAFMKRVIQDSRRREKLPNRRDARRFDFTHTTPTLAQWDLVANVGYYPDGRPGEVFLNSNKVGTDLDVATKDAAILLSYALQYGATLGDIRSSMTRDAQGKPEGVMGTLLDLIGGPKE